MIPKTRSVTKMTLSLTRTMVRMFERAVATLENRWDSSSYRDPKDHSLEQALYPVYSTSHP